MLTFSGLCRDLFLLAHAGLGDGPGPRGARWEQRVADYFAGRGAPTETLPGGYSRR